MAAEIARAASTPSGSAAGVAAAKEMQKPAGPGTVLVVPKKKQASPPLRTPKKPSIAALVSIAAQYSISCAMSFCKLQTVFRPICRMCNSCLEIACEPRNSAIVVTVLCML